jgi:hypothetical protein
VEKFLLRERGNGPETWDAATSAVDVEPHASVQRHTPITVFNDEGVN